MNRSRPTAPPAIAPTAIAPCLSGHARMRDPLRMAQYGCGCALSALSGLLSGCSAQRLHPGGAIGEQKVNLIVLAIALMLLVAIPVIALNLHAAWRKRAANTVDRYLPVRSRSTHGERVDWAIACVIVIVLTVLIGKSTNARDPYRPIASDGAPLRVEAVALTGKWLFIYPDYGIASVNQLRLPVGTQVAFTLTADALKHSFSIPGLGGHVAAMPGIQTRLNLIANHTGIFNGMAAPPDSSGLSDTTFAATSVTQAEFDAWVAQARDAASTLDDESYAWLARDTHSYPDTLYRAAMPGLFDKIANRYTHATPTAQFRTTAPLAAAGTAQRTISAEATPQAATTTQPDDDPVDRRNLNASAAGMPTQ